MFLFPDGVYATHAKKRELIEVMPMLELNLVLMEPHQTLQGCGNPCAADTYMFAGVDPASYAYTHPTRAAVHGDGQK